MAETKATHKLILTLAAAAGIILFIVLLQKIFPYQAANFKVDRAQAIAIAKQYIESSGHHVDDYHYSAITRYNSDAFAFLQEQVGLEKTARLFRDDDAALLGFKWRIRFYKNLPKTAPQQQFLVDISAAGDMVGYMHSIPENMDWPRPERANLIPEDAYERAVQFLNEQNIDISGYVKDEIATKKYEKRTDHTFTWRADYQNGPGLRFHTLTIQGDEIGRYFCFYRLPEAASFQEKEAESGRVFSAIFSITVFFLTFIFLMGIFAKKYHDGEVSVYTATAVFSVLWGTMLLQTILNFRVTTSGWNIGELSYDAVAVGGLIFLGIIVFPIVSLSGLAAWSVGESLAREGFSRKLASLDALINRRFATINYARSAFWGYCFGGIALGGTALLGTVIAALSGGTVHIGGYSDVLSPRFGFLMPVLYAASSSLLAELIFRLFGNLYLFNILKRRNKWLPAVITSVFWAVFSFIFWDFNIAISPIYLNLVIAFIIGLFFSYIFWKYDVLTVMITNFLVIAVMKTIPLITSESESIFMSGIFSLLLAALPLVFMVRGFMKKEVFEYKPETTPGHIKRISERERLQKELEIAHQVQMRLLPKESPSIPGCDIAGICIPAKEVGGDYYDFIMMSDKNVGMVIGDVSGKGVPAAIYMTLTKGIFQSHAEENVSPKDVLVKVNSLMYRTIERGSFVSMFYAVLDMERLTLRYARAGHNPAIYLHGAGESKMLQPQGIGLGLEEGDVFQRVIVEEEITLSKGDLLVFYTDGFTEAMNKNLEEYGEERFFEVVRENEHKSSREIIESVYQDVKSFVKEFPQHDDMTMVVARVD